MSTAVASSSTGAFGGSPATADTSTLRMLSDACRHHAFGGAILARVAPDVVLLAAVAVVVVVFTDDVI